jgi:hypothetical protein
MEASAGQQQKASAVVIIAAEDAGADADADADPATCGGESFTAGTKVLLATGAAILIGQLKPGDKVLATNTKTGKTQAESVAAVLLHHDTDRYDLKIKTAHGSAVIQTTSRHLFWDQTTRRWTEATALRHGSHLSTASGMSATVLGGYAQAHSPVGSLSPVGISFQVETL